MASRAKTSAKASARIADSQQPPEAPMPDSGAAAPADQTRSCEEQTQANFDEFAQLLAPTKYNSPMGKNISAFQPDVEVLAVTLRDMPLSSEQFGVMSSGREWVSMSFCLLNVGPPGFSNVPYTNGKKKGEKETNPLMLYDVTSEGMTCCHSFEKGKTNKDKGGRVSQYKDTEQVDGEDVEVVRDASMVLEAGVTLSVFMREDNFAKTGDDKFNKMFSLDESLDSAVVLKANSLVYLQLSSANIEQVKKGMGLKLRKLKSVPASDPVLNGCFDGLPRSEAAHNAVMERARKQHGLSRMLGKEDEKVFALEVAAGAYATEEDATSCMLCEAHPDTPLVSFSDAQLLQLFAVKDRVQALKLVNIAIALRALRVVVSVRDNPVAAMQSATPFSVACLQIDWNVMLHMHLLAGFEAWPCSQTEDASFTGADEALLRTFVRDGVVFWSDPAHGVLVPGKGKHQVVYAMRLSGEEVSEAQHVVTHMVSDEGPEHGGGGRALDIFLSSLDKMETISAAAQSILQHPEGARSNPGAAHVMRVILRLDNKGASGGKKRKRMSLLS